MADFSKLEANASCTNVHRALHPDSRHAGKCLFFSRPHIGHQACDNSTIQRTEDIYIKKWGVL